MYLLDTSIVSNLRKPKPHPRLVGWISSVDEDELYIPVATVAELRMGTERARRHGTGAKTAEHEEWLAELVATRRIVPLTAAGAELWARMLESPLRDGSFKTPSPRLFKSNWTLDLMIASIAIVSGFTVVTENTKDFLRINEHFELPGLLNPVKDRDDTAPPPVARARRDRRARDVAGTP